MGALVNQNDFTHGELSPKMLARTDLQIYMKGAKRIRNMVVIAQGGAKRRFGTKYITSITATTGQYRLGEFIFDDNNSYLFVFTHLNIAVYNSSDTKVADITTPWTGTMLANNTLDFDQQYNLMVCVEQDTAPYEIYRHPTNEATWTIGVISFKNNATQDFRGDYDAITFTLGAVALGNTTLTASAPIFVAAHAGGFFQGVGDPTSLNQPIGTARITSVTSNVLVNVTVTSRFGITAMIGTNVSLQEVAWSTARGWPLSVTFYEGRLIFGGTKSLIDTLFMSVVNDYANFDVSYGKDSDSIQQKLSGQRIGTIKYIVGDKSLQVFSSRSEHTIPQADGKALTPSGDSIRRQSNEGIIDVSPVVLDNQTFYIKRGGRGVMSFAYGSDQESYNSENISIVSDHLINSPVDMAVISGSQTEDSNYLLVVNGDGTLAIFQSLDVENVAAWSLAETSANNSSQGKFKRATSVDSHVYFIVERVINGATVHFLEKLDFSLYMDASHVATLAPASATITGLNYLEGQLVQVRGDGASLTPKTVTGGSITIDKAVTNVEVGLRYDTLLTTMPVQVESQSGSTAYIKKRITKVFVDYYESLNILVNGVMIPYREFGDDAYEQPPTPKTGIFELNNLDDWDARKTVSITQTVPGPITILGVGYEVSVRQIEGG